MAVVARNVSFLLRSYKHHLLLINCRWIKTYSHKFIPKEIFILPFSQMKNVISIPVVAKYEFFCSKTPKKKPLSINSSVEYEHIAEETLQNLCEIFEDILEKSNLEEWDVNYSNGVLNVSLNHHGSYVLNKQSPNKQIWLSSPISGPKRYDFIGGKWIYKHDGVSLSRILSEEMSSILNEEIHFKDYL